MNIFTPKQTINQESNILDCRRKDIRVIAILQPKQLHL